MTHTATPRPTPDATTLANATWIKSSYSDGAGNNCVEVADLSGTAFAAIAVRDSKDPWLPALSVPPSAWRAFLAAARVNERAPGR
jgi:hypothetical protein